MYIASLDYQKNPFVRAGLILAVVFGIALSASFLYQTGLLRFFLHCVFSSLVTLFFVGFFHWRMRIDSFYLLMILGLPLGLMLSVDWLGFLWMVSGSEDRAFVGSALANSLAIALTGGFWSALGYFGCEDKGTNEGNCLKKVDFLIALAFLAFFLNLAPIGYHLSQVYFSGVTFSPSILSESFSMPDLEALQFVLAILVIGFAVSFLKGREISKAFTNISVCLFLFSAALTTITFVLLGVLPQGDYGLNLIFGQHTGLAIMRYSLFLYIVSFFVRLAKAHLDKADFKTKNWHLAEGFTFLFFMTMGPSTLLETAYVEENSQLQEEINVFSEGNKDVLKAALVLLILENKELGSLVLESLPRKLIIPLAAEMKASGPEAVEFTDELLMAALEKELFEEITPIIDAYQVELFMPTPRAVTIIIDEFITELRKRIEGETVLHTLSSRSIWPDKVAALQTTFRDHPNVFVKLVEEMIAGEEVIDTTSD